ncbi:hypothetical protein KIN20_005335 [Parelaphostrongylus tenuis]|uniref:Uncharacterized protein n=1 Tax=Parelaphostrongylus tenuis TaxID=148309 RepID=A0AAD5LZX9_PARTN|nr:hypothetical protein KIN20_005335 [Parelaphostrongylus tenuis]
MQQCVLRVKVTTRRRTNRVKRCVSAMSDTTESSATTIRNYSELLRHQVNSMSHGGDPIGNGVSCSYLDEWEYVAAVKAKHGAHEMEWYSSRDFLRLPNEEAQHHFSL